MFHFLKSYMKTHSAPLRSTLFSQFFSANSLTLFGKEEMDMMKIPVNVDGDKICKDLTQEHTLQTDPGPLRELKLNLYMVCLEIIYCQPLQIRFQYSPQP